MLSSSQIISLGQGNVIIKQDESIAVIVCLGSDIDAVILPEEDKDDVIIKPDNKIDVVVWLGGDIETIIWHEENLVSSSGWMIILN